MISQADIIYEDSLVCILRPNIKEGVLVFTNYRIPAGIDIRESGIKTGKRLHEEGVEFNRTIIHPYIFFRAPWISNEVDYSTYETEVNSLFGQGHIGIKHRCFIRVDPDKTFVFSSEIRCESPYHNDIDKEVFKSKKTLSEYLRIISCNAKLYKWTTEKQPAYNLYTSKLILVPNNDNKLMYPMSKAPISLNSEILVSLPHLTPEYFVMCT